MADTRTKKTKKITRVKTFFDGTMPLKIYQLAMQGMGDSEIASTLGIPPETFRKWKKDNHAVQHALIEARGQNLKDAPVRFRDYVHGQLSPHLKLLWDELVDCDKRGSSIARLEALLAEAGETGRKHLFLHALIHNNFQIMKSAKQVGISKKKIEKWLNDDAEFAEMVQEIQQIKKDFFESAFIELVRSGDKSAIIHAAKTINADRGYGVTKTLKVQHSGKSAESEENEKVDVSTLTLEEKKLLLEARRRKARIALPEHVENAD